MRRAPSLSAAILFLALAQTSCFMARESVNEPLDPAALAALEPGKSKAEDVARALGAPSDVVQLGRRSAWRYEHVRLKRAGIFLLVVGLLNVDTRSDRAWVFFDEEGVLTHVGSTFDAKDAEYALPWEDLEDE